MCCTLLARRIDLPSSRAAAAAAACRLPPATWKL